MFEQAAEVATTMTLVRPKRERVTLFGGNKGHDLGNICYAAADGFTSCKQQLTLVASSTVAAWTISTRLSGSFNLHCGEAKLAGCCFAPVQSRAAYTFWRPFLNQRLTFWNLAAGMERASGFSERGRERERGRTGSKLAHPTKCAKRIESEIETNKLTHTSKFAQKAPFAANDNSCRFVPARRYGNDGNRNNTNT